MKFLCDNCKAKYQIPDEKVAGRTLRMKCRKCEHDIIIRGQALAARETTGVGRTPERAAGDSGVGPAPRREGSALSADFHDNLGKTPAPVSGGADHDQWHVAINDVPVGPIKRDEIARKIGTGAISASSLCWREGFDDWRPVSEVPQLASLLAQRRSVPPSGASDMGAAVPIGGRLSAPSVHSTRPAPAPVSTPSTPIPATGSVPGAPAVAAAAPLQPVPTEPVAAQRDEGIPKVAWVLIAMALLIGVFGTLVFVNVSGPEPQPGPAVAANTPAPAPEPTPAAAPAPAPEPEAAPTEEEPAEEPEAEEPEPEPEHHARSSDSSMRSRSSSSSSSSSSMRSRRSAAEDAEAAAIARFAGGSGAAPGMLSAARSSSSSMGSGQLDSGDLRRVVTRNRPGLQRCYERSIRGMGSPPSVRINVNISIGASGNVTRVSATGRDVNGLKACLESQVRRWRFPRSGSSTQTRFPVVFSGG